LKIAAIIPVKTFSNAKTRLDLSPQQIEDLCKVMLEEILYTVSISPQIEKIILVTKEEKAIEIGKKFNTITIIDEKEESVNNAVALADKYLLENDLHSGPDSSILSVITNPHFPQKFSPVLASVTRVPFPHLGHRSFVFTVLIIFIFTKTFYDNI